MLRMEKEKYLSKYLKPFVGRIVITNQYDKWKQNKKEFLYDGTIPGKTLRSILPNEIILEFDYTEAGNKESAKAKIEAMHWHTKAVKYLESRKVGFHITDHDGKCPHIRFQIYGLDILPHYIRALYKEQFVANVLKKIDFKSELLSPDRGLLIKENVLVSLELKPHFKPKWNGAIEEITHINTNPYLIPNSNDIKKLQDSFKKDKKEIPQIEVEDVKQEKLSEWFSKYYKEGYRNDVDLAFFGMCRKSGLTEQQAESLYTPIIKNLNYTFDKIRDRRLSSTYDCDNPAIYGYLDSSTNACRELYYCFKTYDKSLVSAEDLFTANIPPIEWDIEGLIITNGYHFLAGLAGKFKTYLSFFMAKSFLTGEPFLGREVKKRRVLLIDEESRERTLKERTIKVLSDLTPEQRGNFKFSISKGIKFTDEHIHQLEEDIKNSKAEIVIMDSFVRFFIGNENSSDDVKKSFQLLKPLMDKYKCSFIIIHHFNKNNSNNINSLRGSSDLSAQCDTIMIINEEYRQHYSLWLEKNRHGEKGDKLKFNTVDSDDRKTLSINYTGTVSQIKISADDRNAEIFYKYLVDNEFENFSLIGNIEKFYKKLGFKKNVIYKIKDILLAQGKLENKGKGFYEVVEQEDLDFKEVH